MKEIIYVRGLNYENAIEIMNFVHNNTKMLASLGQWCVIIETHGHDFAAVETFIKSLNPPFYEITKDNPNDVMGYGLLYHQNSASTSSSK